MHAAHDEAQAMFSSIDVATSLLNQDTESPPKTFRLEDFDSEQQMPTREAQEIIMSHPLAKAQSRTHIQTDQYTPEGRLLGAFTTRSEGITQATYRHPEVC